MLDRLVLQQALNRFLAELRLQDRRVFLQRYWYFRPIREIAADNGLTQSAVKTSLHRSREKLRILLQEEGIAL